MLQKESDWACVLTSCVRMLWLRLGFKGFKLVVAGEVVTWCGTPLSLSTVQNLYRPHVCPHSSILIPNSTNVDKTLALRSLPHTQSLSSCAITFLTCPSFYSLQTVSAPLRSLSFRVLMCPSLCGLQMVCTPCSATSFSCVGAPRLAALFPCHDVPPLVSRDE